MPDAFASQNIPLKNTKKLTSQNIKKNNKDVNCPKIIKYSEQNSLIFFVFISYFFFFFVFCCCFFFLFAYFCCCCSYCYYIYTYGVFISLVNFNRYQVILLSVRICFSNAAVYFDSSSFSSSICNSSTLLIKMDKTITFNFKVTIPAQRNGYRHWKWSRWPVIKYRTRFVAFYFALMPFGKAWIHLFYKLCVNSRADWGL